MTVVSTMQNERSTYQEDLGFFFFFFVLKCILHYSVSDLENAQIMFCKVSFNND